MENISHDIARDLQRFNHGVLPCPPVRAQHPVHTHSHCQSLRALSSVPCSGSVCVLNKYSETGETHSETKAIR